MQVNEYRQNEEPTIVPLYASHYFVGNEMKDFVKDKQKLLLVTLRMLKKDGVFAIHNLMSKPRYGDLDELIKKLCASD